MPMPDWQKVGATGKQGFDTVWGWADKIGAPVNKLTNKIGSEAFWPTTLDKESEKAARILQSFCKDGFYSEEERPTEEARNLSKYSKQRVLKKIPEAVIKKAKGLAIFTVMRTGLWISGAGGSGVLLARMENGEWSPPSGILIHTVAGGFVFGADIYDCVVVINNDKALEAFKAIRATLGGELSAVAGPVGMGAVVDMEVHGKTPPVFTYMKSRGFYAGLGANGTLIIERKDENAKFYREEIRAADILKGRAKHVPVHDIKVLMTTVKAAQGDTDIDRTLLLESGPSPGDLELERMGDGTAFGLPSADDPDPFGVHALEEEGFEIREAGTGLKVSSNEFDYKPAPSSPAYNALHRMSLGPAIGSPTSSRHSSMPLVPKYKMSNPRMVYYADNGAQTMTEEEREEEMEQEAARRAEMTELDSEEKVAKTSPPPLPVRGPPPALPPRTSRPNSGTSAMSIPATLDELTSGGLADDTHENTEPRGIILADEELSQEPEPVGNEHIEQNSAHKTAVVVNGPYIPHHTAVADDMEEVELHGTPDNNATAASPKRADHIPGSFD